MTSAEMPAGTAATVDPPVGLLAELTHRCPLQCLYCSNPLELDRASAELSTDMWLDAFRQAADLGVLQLHLSGGEPTARKDLEILVAGAAGAGLYTNLITAGVTLSRERIHGLVDAGLNHVQISLQDTTEEGTRAVSRFRGGLERKLAAAAAVRDAGVPLTINAPVHRLNLDRLGDMIDLAVSLRADRLEVAHVQYHGWAMRNRTALMPTRDQVERSVELVAAARERLRGVLAIDFVAPDYYAVLPKPCMGGWGRRFMMVTPVGEILPCHAAKSIPGLVFESVRDRSLRDAWFDATSFQAFRGTAWMKEPCRSCPQRTVDFGGCRCQALALTGDAANADPVCAKSLHHAQIAEIVAREVGDSDAPRRYRAHQAPAGVQP
jgi:pyrroloquinoline quinone biosynthesis protein E